VPSVADAAQRSRRRRRALLVRLWPRAKARADELYHELNRRTWALEAQGRPAYQVRAAAKALKATADAEIDALWARVQRARDTNAREERKLEQ
jgi:hypothetical protein